MSESQQPPAGTEGPPAPRDLDEAQPAAPRESRGAAAAQGIDDGEEEEEEEQTDDDDDAPPPYAAEYHQLNGEYKLLKGQVANMEASQERKNAVAVAVAVGL